MQTNFITTSDKTELFVRDWPLSSETEKRGSVLIIHGLGDHSERYSHVAEFFNDLGFEVRSYDHRGHGKSEGPRGVIPYEEALLDDAKMIYDDFAGKQTEKPFLFGHSMGGAVALRCAVEKMINPRGLILSSPAITAKVSFSDKVQLKIGRLTPNLIVPNKLAVEYLSHDKKVVEDYKTDKLVHDKITPRLANFILDSGQESLKKAPNFHIPTLLLVAGDDRLVDATGSRQLFEKLPSDSAKIHFYDNLYHEIFNETPEEREEVFADLKNWLLSQV